jgi:broad specificity phosphatase PhoE
MWWWRARVRLVEVWLLRHAETEWSRDGRHTGRTDVPLTEEGRARARELAHRIAGREFALVLSSPLSRALETAELVGLVPQVRDDLVEFDYGEYEGITTAQIRERRPDWYLWRDGSPKGETAADVGRRVDRVIEETLRADGDVALVAHGHVLRALAARWVEQPASFGGRLRLDTGTISVLGFEREVRVIRRWNT